MPTKAEWPADKVERRKVASLLPYARNARTHTDAQVKQIADSIGEFGFTNPVLVDEDGTIIAGHGRVLAAKRLKLDTVPVMVASGWTEAQRRAYVIADNQLALNAGWDEDTLRDELRALGEMGFDLALTGFDDIKLASFIAGTGEGLTDPDDVPDAQAVAVSRLGDVWVMGEHRLVCGDSTDAATVEAVLAGETADVCLTDPPYGLGDTASRKNKYSLYVDTRANLTRTVEGFLPIALSHAAAVVLTPGVSNLWLYPEPAWTMAWFTPAGAGSGPWGFCCWQPILCYGKDPKLSHGMGRHPDAVVHTEAAGDHGHPCAKPVNFWAWLLERVSERGALALDLFMGSGTSLISAETSGRRCAGVEIDPAYVDVAVRRWQAYTGRSATLDGTTSTFDEIAAKRAASEAA